MSDSDNARGVHFPTVLSQRHQPARTCVGCRQQGLKKDLVRLVVVADVVTIDEASTLPGRGAYIHRDRACWEVVSRRGQLARAFRATGRIDTSTIGTYLTEETTLTDVRER